MRTVGWDEGFKKGYQQAIEEAVKTIETIGDEKISYLIKIGRSEMIELTNDGVQDIAAAIRSLAQKEE